LLDQSLHTTLAQQIHNCPEGMRWAVERFAVLDDGETLAAAICQGQAIAVCNGSYKDDFGMAAYVLEGATSVNRLVVVLVVPGTPANQSSYQSELAGLYGVVVMVHLICEQYGITSGAIEVGCDCEGALCHVFTSGQPSSKLTMIYSLPFGRCFLSALSNGLVTMLLAIKMTVSRFWTGGPISILKWIVWQRFTGVTCVTNPKWKTPLLHMSTGQLVYVAKKFLLGLMNVLGSISWVVHNVITWNERVG
jgi:hypothetical protein